MTQIPFSPVVLSHRHDGWTAERQERFINVLATTGSVVRAAQTVAMSPRSAHRLRRHPMAGEFRAAWDAALQQVWGSLAHADCFAPVIIAAMASPVAMFKASLI